ncbi:MAG: hypothetical protein GTO63_34470 [Anaerolineae bacterium]|nr:hypothetical protein [Anaerolineae bacterium]NIN99760.1 hypothetical protein [Anaerolineae bacterium]NIQ82590.1 hypothetical protein [Anaerolineae bacterium]
MAKKRGPKVIWVCPEDQVFETRKSEAKRQCTFVRWDECEDCPGPVKYVREDKK